MQSKIVHEASIFVHLFPVNLFRAQQSPSASQTIDAKNIFYFIYTTGTH